VRVDVIGSSGTYPAAGRPTAGFLITHRSTRVWSEAGAGVFTRIPIDPDLVDAVVVSHQHPDHCSDLITALHGWGYRPNPRWGVPLYAPQAVWDRVTAFFDKEPGAELYEVFDFRPVVGGDEAEIGEISVSFVEMDHPVPTVGSRWTAGGHSLFYTADTGPGGDWASRAEGAHLMLSEATRQGDAGDKEHPHHLTASEAGRIAREAQVKRLALTHIPPHLDPARSVHEAELAFDRPVRLAAPGACFDV